MSSDFCMHAMSCMCLPVIHGHAHMPRIHFMERNRKPEWVPKRMNNPSKRYSERSAQPHLASLLNYTEHLNNNNYSQNLPQSMEGALGNTFHEASDYLTQNLVSVTRKLQADSTYEYGWKFSVQNISKLDAGVCKGVMPHAWEESMSGM